MQDIGTCFGLQNENDYPTIIDQEFGVEGKGGNRSIQALQFYKVGTLMFKCIV